MSETGVSYPIPRPRLTADERREVIVAAAMEEFAARGLAGASVDAVARKAGVSQPYVFQLFGTKKELFLAVVRRAFERTRLTFEASAADQVRGNLPDCNDALAAMGYAYQRLLADRTLLMLQLQAYAACSDPDVRTMVRTEFHRLHTYVVEASGATPEQVHRFFAEGMLLNVGAAVQLPGEPIDWTLDMLGGAV